MFPVKNVQDQKVPSMKISFHLEYARAGLRAEYARPAQKVKRSFHPSMDYQGTHAPIGTEFLHTYILSYW